MLSFVIIGRNEGWKLSKCFESVFKTIEYNDLKDYEVIYVDSKSTDDSIARAKKFPKIKVFQITGQCNAAIGRNIGVKEAIGDVLLFIDGDMEIQADFLPLVYNKKNGLKYDFVSGQWINYNYDTAGNLISKENYDYSKNKDKKIYTTGGLFFIKRKIWIQVGGMKNKMRRSQDLDMGLRLAKKGIFLFRKKELLAIHHTIPYNDKKRMWEFLLTGSKFYRIILLRENLFNKFEWYLFVRGNYTFLILIFSLVCAIAFKRFSFIFFYILSIAIRSYLNMSGNCRLFLPKFIFFLFYESVNILVFFLFWPKKQKLKYKPLGKNI